MAEALGPDDFKRVGLYDPAAADAEDRLATLEYLVSLGATEAELAGAANYPGLPGPASDLTFHPKESEPVSFAELTERSGLTPEQVRRVTLAAGLPIDEGAAFTEADVTTMSLFHVAAALFGEDAVLQMVRVMASSLIRIAPSELGVAMSAFEARAWDAVTAYDARVVKQIGDEVMFVAVTAADACAIAIELVEWVCAHPVLRAARGGVATGAVLTQGGDFYGPTVNLAARSAKVARPGTVVASASVRDSVPPRVT